MNRLMSMGDETRLLWKRERPFHCLRNMIHSLSSSRHSREREIRSSSAWADEASKRRCEIKGRPWGMMRMAKFKCPSNDRRSRLQQHWLSMRVEATRIILSTSAPAKICARMLWATCGGSVAMALVLR